MSKQIMFTKQIINAKEALRIRLINNIYPQNELMDRAKELSKMISKNGNNAIKKAKKAINEGNRNVANDKNIYKLKCACQNYDWGKYANDSLVATALRKNGETVDDKKRYAEYWMGTHPNGPSKIIKNNKEILLSDDINGQLSYLFKILSIEKPLSIQLHPDKTFAEILNKKFPKIYKDDNHKPELFIALSDFELLFGFIEVNKAVEVIKKYKNCFNLKEGEKLIANPNIENYKEFIERLIYLEKNDYEKILKLILESEEKKVNKLIKKLYDYYGLDSGLLISLFMNHLHKKKGRITFY
jgi:mannose-6-phosphate isomerase